MNTIAVISLEGINNAGEEILRFTTSQCFKKENVNVKRVEIDPKYTDLYYNLNFFSKMMSKILLKVNYKFFDGNNYHLKKWTYIISRKKYYREELKNVNAIVYALGMLKFKTQDISFMFHMINKEAYKQGIPVMMSAMSIAAADENDRRYHQLLKAVNYPSVKMITTRDGIAGIRRLRNDYIRNSDVDVRQVGDPALMIPDFYGIKRSESNLIGINLIRKDIFKNYGKNFSSEQMTDFYCGLIKEIEKRNLNWVFFCNGIKSDYEFGKELLRNLNLDESKLIRCPHNAEEFIKDVSNFNVILGARLHACITSVSLGIPVVGLLWDDKLRYFSETMGIADFFVDETNIKPCYIADLIQIASHLELDMDNILKLKEQTRKSFIDFTQNNLKGRDMS